jgi:carbon storage regulator
MLCLSRKVREQIVIGGTITVTLLEIKGNQIRLGIEAPKDVSIFRKELISDPTPPPAVAHQTKEQS